MLSSRHHNVSDGEHAGPHRSSQIDGGQELLPGFRLIAKRAQHTARHHGRFTLVDASAGHTSMGPFDDDRYALGLETRSKVLAISAVILS